MTDLSGLPISPRGASGSQGEGSGAILAERSPGKAGLGMNGPRGRSGCHRSEHRARGVGNSQGAL